MQAKPEAKKWMTTPISFYDKLMDLYAKDRANGEGSLTAKERARQRSNVEKDSPPNNIEVIDELVGLNKITLENFGSDAYGLPTLASSSSSKSEIKAESSSKGKKRKGSPEGDYEVQVLKEGLDSVADAIREGNSILKQIRPRVYSSDEIFDEIVKLGVEDNKQFKAYRFLNAKDTRVREFFGCPQRIRRAFLDQMMEEDGSSK